MGPGSGQEASSLYQAFLDSDKPKLTGESGPSLDPRLPEVHPASLQQVFLAPLPYGGLRVGKVKVRISLANKPP